MATNQYYYNKGKEITSKEAHELTDKSGLVVADRPVNFDVEFKKYAYGERGIMAAGDVITLIEDSAAKKGNYFDGTDDYVLHDAHAVARVAANDSAGTYSAWIYISEVVGSHCILSAGDNDTANEYLRFSHYQEDLTFKSIVGGVTQIDCYASNCLETRKWTHVALVQNGTVPVFYVNGVAQTTGYLTSTDTGIWYEELNNCDKFAMGILEFNGTHTTDFNGAIGQVKYWNKALIAAEVAQDYNGEALYDDATYLQLNVTMADDGITDSGLGDDDGTLTGHAHYGGNISTHSIALERNTSGHAAERSTSVDVSPRITKTIIVRGD